MVSLGPWCHFFTPSSFVCCKVLVHGAAIAENGSWCDFLLNHGPIWNLLSVCPVITGVSEDESFPRTVFSLFLCLVHPRRANHPFGLLASLGGRVQDRSEEPDFPDLCFTICSNVTWGERVGGTVLRSGRRELNGSVGCSEASRSVMVGVWMGVRRVRSGRMVMT